ncbi:DUF4395 family protein [Actinotalea ferrariae]
MGARIGVDGIGHGLTAVAAVLAVINATSGVCLGCRIFLRGRRLQRARA